MKKYLCIYCILLTVAVINAQTTDVFYANSDQKKVKKGEKMYKWVVSIAGKEKIEYRFDMVVGTLLQRTPYIIVKNWNALKKDSVSKWLKHGVEIMWSDGKIKKTEEKYYFGVKHGDSKTYYSTGELMKKDSFYSGFLQKSYFYYKNGEAILTYDKEDEDVWVQERKDLIVFLKDHFTPVYSHLANKSNEIYLKLTIGIDGIAKDCRIINSTNRKATKLFSELVRKLPQFYTTFKDNEPVEETILIPIARNQRNQIILDYRPNTNTFYQRTLYNSEKMKG